VTARGFTLIETVVALAITAVILTALATAIPAALAARRTATEHLERAATLRAVLVHLDRELAGALAEGFVVSEPPDAVLRFVGGPEPGLQLLYRVEQGALVRRTAPRGAAPPAPAGPPTALLDGVRACRFAAFDGETWRSTWTTETPPPAVRLTLDLADGTTIDRVVTIATGRAPRTT
jgi:general secretion pathway protein J